MNGKLCDKCELKQKCPHNSVQENDEDLPDDEKYKDFIEYFGALEEQGIPYGMSDLARKAIELGLPRPIFCEKLEIIGWFFE